MGSSLSLFLTPRHSTTVPSLGDLPESCVASVMVYLDPSEICSMSMLNRGFRAASSADFVWESKLPLNYESIIERVFDDFDTNLCKRDIYARLCRPSYFDGGTKKVWLDKGTGRVCLSVSANGLAITGIDDRRYWSRIETDESRISFPFIPCRFQSVAYLQQIWWFEVDGEVDFPFPAGSYSIFYRLQVGRASRRFGRRICNSEHVHGWDKKPVQFQLSTSDGQQATTQCNLKEPGKWKYHHVGDFIVTGSTTTTKVKFSMTQIDCTHTKGGLCVDSVLICPSEFTERLKRF
ncbi:F-box protein PP2-A13-like isoform X1 [Lycium ferocissimum]|uniref:F-box protein PP2-A13-like isoform X1 n=1 Tax=Lycium ferocissimum TaxID=112874 RepID=UPI0028153CB7|nr:F-box protein PP2-A13-like isoform X1 [Lycium ferocissimum]